MKNILHFEAFTDKEDIKFNKDDVRVILDLAYDIIDKQDEYEGTTMYTIRVPNIYKTDKDDKKYYDFVVYFGDNYISIHPKFDDVGGKKLLKLIEDNILNDLKIYKKKD